MVGDVYECRVYVKNLEQVAQSVLHFRVTGEVGGGPDQADIAQGLFDVLSPLWSNWCGDEASILGCRTQRILGGRLDAFLSAGPVSTGNKSDVLPGQSCGLIRLSTGNAAGRRGHGRIYVAFGGRDDVTDNGRVSAAGIAALENIGNVTTGGDINIATGASNADFRLGVLSRVESICRDVTSVTVAAGFASQKRRGVFGRPDPSPF